MSYRIWLFLVLALLFMMLLAPSAHPSDYKTAREKTFTQYFYETHGYAYRDRANHPPRNKKLVDRDKDGFTANIDCNDNNKLIYPGAIEIVNNGIDENCNGMADDVYTPPPPPPVIDNDHDTYSVELDCDDGNPNIHPNATEILYNGIDENCNGMADDVVDGDNDGFNSNVDCNDNNFNINPSATEIVNNGIDENCNGMSDDVPPVYYTVQYTLEWDASPTPEIDGYTMYYELFSAPYQYLEDYTSSFNVGDVLTTEITVDKFEGWYYCFYVTAYQTIGETVYESGPSNVVCGDQM